MALVTCSNSGQALLDWLETATPAQVIQLCTALGCGPSRREIARVFADCEGNVHFPDDVIPTCDEFNAALTAAIAQVLLARGSTPSVALLGAGLNLTGNVLHDESLFTTDDGLLALSPLPPPIPDTFLAFSSETVTVDQSAIFLDSLAVGPDLIMGAASDNDNDNDRPLVAVHNIDGSERWRVMPSPNPNIFTFEDVVHSQGRFFVAGVSLPLGSDRFAEVFSTDSENGVWKKEFDLYLYYNCGLAASDQVVIFHATSNTDQGILKYSVNAGATWSTEITTAVHNCVPFHASASGLKMVAMAAEFTMSTTTDTLYLLVHEGAGWNYHPVTLPGYDNAWFPEVRGYFNNITDEYVLFGISVTGGNPSPVVYTSSAPEGPWQPQTTSVFWEEVQVDGGGFLAVEWVETGAGGFPVTKTTSDGFNWVEGPALEFEPEDTYVMAAASGGGKHYLTGTSSLLAISSDGLNWPDYSSSPLTSDSSVWKIVQGNGLTLAVNYYNDIAKFTPGAGWDHYDSSRTTEGYFFWFAGGLFFSVGMDSGGLVVSTDAKTWEERPFNLPGVDPYDLMGVVEFQGAVYASVGGGRVAKTSDLGNSWELVQPSDLATFETYEIVAVLDQLLVYSPQGAAFYSSDGAAWQPLQLPTAIGEGLITEVGGRALAFAQFSNTFIAASSLEGPWGTESLGPQGFSNVNLITFTSVPSGGVAAVFQVETSSGDLFGKVRTTADGASWADFPLPIYKGLTAFSFIDEQGSFVTGGISGQLTSTLALPPELRWIDCPCCDKFLGPVDGTDPQSTPIGFKFKFENVGGGDGADAFAFAYSQSGLEAGELLEEGELQVQQGISEWILAIGSPEDDYVFYSDSGAVGGVGVFEYTITNLRTGQTITSGAQANDTDVFCASITFRRRA